MSSSSSQLETVLRLRRRGRDSLRRELGEALRAASVLDQQEAELEQTLGEAVSQRQAALSQPTIDPELFLAAGRHELALRTQAQGLAENRAKIEEEIERRRVRVAEAEREVRAIQKLTERLAERARLKEARREQLLADEFAARKHTAQQTEDDLLPLR